MTAISMSRRSLLGPLVVVAVVAGSLASDVPAGAGASSRDAVPVLVPGFDVDVCGTVGAPGGFLPPPLASLAAVLDARPAALAAETADAVRDEATEIAPGAGAPACLDGVGGALRVASRPAAVAGTDAVETFAADLAAHVEAVAAVTGRGVDLVGYSAGGLAIRLLLAEHPDAARHVERVVLIAVPQEGSWLAAAAAELDGGDTMAGAARCARRAVDAVDLGEAAALALCAGVVEARDLEGGPATFLSGVLGSAGLMDAVPGSSVVRRARDGGFAGVDVLQIAVDLTIEVTPAEHVALAGWSDATVPAPPRDVEALRAGDLVVVADAPPPDDGDDGVHGARGGAFAHPTVEPTAASITSRTYQPVCTTNPPPSGPGSPLLVRAASTILGACATHPGNHAVLPRATQRRLRTEEGSTSVDEDVAAFLDG